MTFDLLQRAKVARDHLHVIVGQLASQHGIEQRYVEQKLTELH